VKSQLKTAKDHLNKLKDELAEMRSTAPGQAYENLQATLEELEKQKLLNALDDFEKYERDKMFIGSYLKNGNIVMENVLDGDRIKDQNFIDGCNFAKERFSDPLLKDDWQNNVLAIAKMVFSSDPGKFIIPQLGFLETTRKKSNPDDLLILKSDELDVVSDNNKDWLIKEINHRIRSVRVDAVELQKNLFSLIYQHLEELVDKGDMSFLANTEAERISKRFSEATDEEREQLPLMVSAAIRGLVKLIVEKSQINLLTEE